MNAVLLWIIIAIAVAIVVVGVGVGLLISRRRRINLREAGQVEQGEAPPKPPQKGTYQAGGGFSFSSGGATATAPAPSADTAPPADTAAAPPADTAAASPADTAPAATPAPPADTAAPETTPPPAAPESGAATATPETTVPSGDTDASDDDAAQSAPPVTPAAPTAADGVGTAMDARTPPRGFPAAGTATDARTPPDGIPVTPPPDAPTATTPPAAKPPVATPPAAAPSTDTAPPTAPTPPAPQTTAPLTTAPPTVSAPATGATAPAPTAPPVSPPAAEPAAPAEEIEPSEGRLQRLRGKLARSRSGFGQSLLGLLGAGELDEESWEDVETTLLQADLGPEMALELVDTLRAELATRGVRTAEQARAVLRDVLVAALRPELDRSVAALPHDGRPAVVLVVGVNGTGKTTTTGKLARVLVANGRHIVLGAADTFRAAAAEQLMTWGERAGAAVVRGAEGADPASVAFEAVKRGTADGADAVLLDTAGRLHTKTGLMDELGKVKRVVEKQAEVDEVLLVLDATTGQNGMIQARVFGDVVNVTGIVLTKLDGTAKGGIVFRVQRELGVPVKLVGLGEGPDDLAPFEPAAFVDALLT